MTSATLNPLSCSEAEARRELVQLRHAVRARALMADDDHDIARELAGLERLHHVVLIVEHARRRFDDAMLRLHGGNLDHRAARDFRA